MADGVPLSTIPKWHWGAVAAVFGVLMFLVTVVTLHLLQPAYDPVHQLMSELALGPYGWAMILAFAGLALATIGVQATLGNFGSSQRLRLLLSAAAVFFLAAGVFPLGSHPEIHIAAIASAFVLSVLAMYLFPSGAGRAANAAPRALSWCLAAGVAVSVALGHSVLPMGIGQRLAALCLVTWLAILGWKLARGRNTAEQLSATDAQVQG